MRPRSLTLPFSMRFGAVLAGLGRAVVGTSLAGALSAIVLPVLLVTTVQPPSKHGPLAGDRTPLGLPLAGSRAPATLAELGARANLEGRPTAADIRRARHADGPAKLRMLRANPYYRIYTQAKHRYGVSWYLLAAVHPGRVAPGAGDLARVMNTARKLQADGATDALDARAWRAMTVVYGGTPAARARATAMIEQARAWKALGVIPLPRNGKLATPVDGVVPGCGYFHCPRPGHLHNGLDLSAPTGSPIHAVDDGRVALLESPGESGGYGNFICLQHRPDLATCYAHLSQFAPGLRLGSHVTRGVVIGLVGCTGNCFGPHLHFEVRRGPAECITCAVDPVPFLSGKVPDVPAPDFTRVPRFTAVAAPAPAQRIAVAPATAAPRAPAPAVRAPVPARIPVTTGGIAPTARRPARPRPAAPRPAPPVSTGGAQFEVAPSAPSQPDPAPPSTAGAQEAPATATPEPAPPKE